MQNFNIFRAVIILWFSLTIDILAMDNIVVNEKQALKSSERSFDSNIANIETIERDNLVTIASEMGIVIEKSANHLFDTIVDAVKFEDSSTDAASAGVSAKIFYYSIQAGVPLEGRVLKAELALRRLIVSSVTIIRDFEEQTLRAFIQLMQASLSSEKQIKVVFQESVDAYKILENHIIMELTTVQNGTRTHSLIEETKKIALHPQFCEAMLRHLKCWLQEYSQLLHSYEIIKIQRFYEEFVQVEAFQKQRSNTIAERDMTPNLSAKALAFTQA